MNKSIFWKLIWPESSKMQVLGEILDFETLFRLVKHFEKKKKKDRIVYFPKSQTIDKLLAYYFGKKVESGEMTWEEVMKKLKGSQKFLKDAGLSRKNIKKLFAQRKLEILREKRRDEK